LDSLRLEEPRYVFQYGDLAAHNILIDPRTLQVKALITWEYAGFPSPGMDRWPGNVNIGSGNDVAYALAKFLAEKYPECYHQRRDKAQLVSLIQSGKLPDPEKLGQLPNVC
jgi:hypothetical protein